VKIITTALSVLSGCRSMCSMERAVCKEKVHRFLSISDYIKIVLSLGISYNAIQAIQIMWFVCR